MKFIDVRVRLPISKMGKFMETLPPWSSIVGYDMLRPVEPKLKRTNGRDYAEGYRPGKGTAAEAVLKVLTKGPMHRYELINRLAKVQKEKAVGSAIQTLANKGIITKNKDGTYGKA